MRDSCSHAAPRAMPLAAWMLTLTAAALALLWSAPLLPRCPRSFDELLTAVERWGIAPAAFAVLRVAGLVMVWYLAMLTLASLITGLGSWRARRVLARMPAGRSVLLLISGGVRASLAAIPTAVALPLAAGAEEAPPPISAPEQDAPVLQHSSATEPHQAPAGGGRALLVPLSREQEPSGTATMEGLDQPPGSAGSGPHQQPQSPTTADGAGAPPGTGLGEAPPQPGGEAADTTGARSDATSEPHAGTPSQTRSESHRSQGDRTWTVQRGDHLWAIAAETVREVEPSASDGVIANYWVNLIEANRDRLLDPDLPDLIYPGQVLVLLPVDV